MDFLAGRTQKILALAPMEGVVDPIMRDIYTRLGGIDFCVTEFVRVTDKPVPHHVFFKYSPELENGGKTAAGTPVMVQLLGGQPEPLAENARRAMELGAPGIDLNFGCPAKTVNRHDGGATLLQYPERLEKIVSAVRQAVPLTHPASAKIRLGFADKSLFMENALAAEQGGASFLTVHARTKLEGYKPPAHWEFIAEIRNRLKIPVIANGDIWQVEDFNKCAEITQCDHFMLGRGAIAKPDLFATLRGGSALSLSQVLELVQAYIDQALLKSDRFACGRFKQWMKALMKNYPLLELFEKTKRLKTMEEIQQELSVFRNSVAVEERNSTLTL